MVGVMMGGKGEPRLRDPLPSTRLGVCRGTPGSYLWLSDRLLGMTGLSGAREFLQCEAALISICCRWKVLGGGRNSSDQGGRCPLGSQC